MFLAVVLPLLAACVNASSPEPTRQSGPVGTSPTPSATGLLPTRSSAQSATAAASEPDSSRSSVTPAPATAASTGQAGTARTAVAGAGVPTSTGTVCRLAGDNRGFADADQFLANLTCVVQEFPWPQGRVADPAWIVAQIPEAANSSFEVGFEYSIITTYNECAWYTTWLDARRSGDAAVEAQALAVITNVIPNYAAIVPNIPADLFDASTLRSQQEMAARAALGDPALVQEYVTGACQSIAWKTS